MERTERMEITDAQRRRRQLVRLELDGEPSAMIDNRTWEESPYRVGSFLSREELAALEAESQSRRAREKAMYLLSLRAHSRSELKQKLRRESGEEQAERTAARMEEIGLVDDTAFAAAFARELAERRHFSRRHVLMELGARGIDRETAQEAVESLDIDDMEQALALLRKKYYNKLSDEDGRRKTSAALARAGFDGRTARRAMDALAADGDYDTEGPDDGPEWVEDDGYED